MQASITFSQICIPSLKTIFTSCLGRVCCFDDATSHDDDVTAPIMDHLEKYLNNFSMLQDNRNAGVMYFHYKKIKGLDETITISIP